MSHDSSLTAAKVSGKTNFEDVVLNYVKKIKLQAKVIEAWATNLSWGTRSITN